MDWDGAVLKRFQHRIQVKYYIVHGTDLQQFLLRVVTFTYRDRGVK